MDKNMSHTFDSPDTGPTTAFYQGAESGRRKERERIIKLLDDNASGDYKQVMLTPKLIALIEGNQNEI
jgi:hypothetical protein